MGNTNNTPGHRNSLFLNMTKKIKIKHPKLKLEENILLTLDNKKLNNDIQSLFNDGYMFIFGFMLKPGTKGHSYALVAHGGLRKVRAELLSYCLTVLEKYFKLTNVPKRKSP